MTFPQSVTQAFLLFNSISIIGLRIKFSSLELTRLSMFTFVRKLVLIFISILFSKALIASHIVGGEIEYTFVKNNATQDSAFYHGKLLLYRDPSGVNFDGMIEIGIFENSNGSNWISNSIIGKIELSNSYVVNTSEYRCDYIFQSHFEVEIGEYEFDFILPINDKTYQLAYQKCCRNNGISNIEMPGATGAVYDARITSESIVLKNNSPKFKDILPTIICLNEDLHVDLSAHDVDGDELKYSLCEVLVSGGIGNTLPQCCNCQNPDAAYCAPPYSSVIYEFGYSVNEPLGASSTIYIDPVTGIINGKATQIGKYVLAVCIEEYRHGVLMSTLRRDFEFNVENCGQRITTALEADSVKYLNSDSIYVFDSCPMEEVNIISNISHPELIVNYTWQLELENNIILNENGSTNISLNFESLESGQYYGQLITQSIYNCFDTLLLEINVTEELNPRFEITSDPCNPMDVYFENTTEVINNDYIEWAWFVDEVLMSNLDSWSYLFASENQHMIRLEALDNQGCRYSDEQNHEPIEDNALPIVQNFNIDLCYGESIFIDNQEIIEERQIEEYIFTKEFGCDSIINHYNINIHSQTVYRFK